MLDVGDIEMNFKVFGYWEFIERLERERGERERQRWRQRDMFNYILSVNVLGVKYGGY